MNAIWNRPSFVALLAVSLLGASPQRASVGLPSAQIHADVTRVSGWLSSAVSPATALAYISDENRNAVLIFPQAGLHPLPIGEIVTGIDEPDGLFVDERRTLYVANVRAKTVTAYEQGHIVPSMTYSIGLHDPIGVTVGTDGTVYVSDFDGSGPDGSIVEYHRGVNRPILILRGFAPVGPGFSALRSDDSLFVTNGGFPRSIESSVLQFAPHSSIRRNTGIQVDLNAGGMAFDGLGNLLVVDQRFPVPAIYIYPPQSRQPANVITAGFAAPFQIAFNAAHTLLYVTDPGSSAVEVFSYPRDEIVNTISSGIAVPAGIALTP